MDWVYKKHYTRQEARALLPQVNEWLEELTVLRDRLAQSDEQLRKLLGLGDDLGGDIVNKNIRTIATVKDLLMRFKTREIQIKDLERGLVDFPAFVGGKEVFLCWERGEDDIEFWHDLNTGYAGREKLSDDQE